MAVMSQCQCEVCHAEVTETRRGRCWGCYSKWADHRPVGIGARCICCAEKRRDVLRRQEILGAWLPICFNCSGQVAALTVVPSTIRELRSVLQRDRRDADRRSGNKDKRVYQRDRRLFERRFGRDADFIEVEEEMLIDIFAAQYIENGNSQKEELTKIADAETVETLRETA